MAQARTHARRPSRPKLSDIASGVAKEASPDGPFVVRAPSGGHSPQRGGGSVSSASNGSMIFTIRSSASSGQRTPSILQAPAASPGSRSPTKNGPAKLSRNSFSAKVGPDRTGSSSYTLSSHDSSDDKNTIAESKAGEEKEEEEKEDSGKTRKDKKKQKKRSGGGSWWFGSTPVLKDPRAISLVKRLYLTPAHLRKFKAKFESVDIDGSGTIDIDEFFDMIKEQRSPLTDALFALIDCDSTSAIDFDEFVRVVCTYSMFTKEEILRFCFRYFDTDDSGSIDEKEYMALARTVNNAAPMFPANFQTALQQFDVNDDGLIDFQEFMEIDRRFPLVLYPAYRLQDRMQKETLGERTWLRVIETVNKQRKIAEYMATHNGQGPPVGCFESCCPCFGTTRQITYPEDA